MTAQVPEILLYNGQSLTLTATPLEFYLCRLRKTKRPSFVWLGTDCYRGYVGTWTFQDGMLCLVGMEATLMIDNKVVMADMAAALPAAGPSLRATWVTGHLSCPEGRLIHYAHSMFNSIYERNRVFTVERGRLLAEHVVLNPPLPITYRIEPDGSRAHVRYCGDTDTAQPDPLDGRPLSDAHVVWGAPPVTDEGYVLGGAFVRSP